MAQNEPRKAFRKLIRPEYEFRPIVEGTADEIQDQTRNCDCADVPPGLDPVPPIQDFCYADAFILCGNSCATTTGICDPAMTVFIKKTSQGELTPDYIFVPTIGIAGACFEKYDVDLFCSTANGPLLLAGQYQALVHSEEAPACSNPPCFIGDCPWIKFVICETDDGFEQEGVDQVLSISSEVCFTFTEGPNGVRWQEHCYSKAELYCLAEPEEGSRVITNAECADLQEIVDCNDPLCVGTGCCGNAVDIMITIRDGVEERLKAKRGGSLPSVWSNPNYILHFSPNEIDGTDENTPCEQRYNAWRHYLNELSGQMGFSLLNAAVSEWINTDIYADGKIEAVPISVIPVFQVIHYMNTIDGTSPVDTDVTWHLNDFGITYQDEEETIVKDVFTMGGEGGFGFVDFMRFGDSDPHVVVNDPDNLDTWCNLVNETAARILAFVQKLWSLRKHVFPENFIGKVVSADLKHSSCSASVSCVSSNIASIPYGSGYGFDEDCSDPVSLTGGATFIGVTTNTEPLADSYFASASTSKGNFSYDLSYITSGGVAFLYISLTYPTLPITATHVFGNTPRPIAYLPDIFGEWSGAGVVVGTAGVTPFLNDGVLPNDYQCTGGEIHVSWRVDHYNAWIVFHPNFVV